VLLARDRNDERLWIGADGSHAGVSEVVNDIDQSLINFYRVLKNPEQFSEFQRLASLTPLSRNEWEGARDGKMNGLAKGPGMMMIANAMNFFTHCRQSLAGRRDGFTSLTRNRTRRGMNGNASEWLGAVDGLPEVHERLRSVVFECMDAVRLIKREDTLHTLFYCDPPYLHETRTSPDVYAHEMSEAKHRELLNVLLQCKGKVMLSGYRSELYDCALKGWTTHEFNLANNAAGGASKRRMTEVLWCNFAPRERTESF
jgi:DNA adenine methylase